MQSLGVDDQTKIELATTLFQQSDSNSEERYLAEQVLITLFQGAHLPMERFINAARSLFQSSVEGSEERKVASQLLLQVVQRADLSVEQTINVAQSLYQASAGGSEEGRFAIQLLLQVAQERHLSADQRLLAIARIFTMTFALYAEKLQAMQLALELLSREITEQFFEAHWRPVRQSIEPELSDIPLLARFACEERLPVKIRNVLYQTLRNMVPQLVGLKP